ncbi:hypothetical protein MJM59_32270, partial [Salmonella enterica subsp. enterica serovar Montevideo]|nr:hypothetical protein [Salmonella enterica subsp. enterica serovar Montevideo]
MATTNTSSKKFGDRYGATSGSDGTVKTALENLGLGETINLAAGAVQKTGDEMNGKLTLPQTS